MIHILARPRDVLFTVAYLAILLPSAVGAPAVELISRRAPTLTQRPVDGGASFSPVYSSDGKHLLFASSSLGLADNPKSSMRVDLYDYTGAGKPLKLLTLPQGGKIGASGQSIPIGVASNNAVYLSSAPDIYPGLANHVQELYAHNYTTGNRRLLSRNKATGEAAEQDVVGAMVTESGRYVLFQTSAVALSGVAATTQPQIYRADLANGDTVQLVSHPLSGSGPDNRTLTGMTANSDGTVVAYVATGAAPPVVMVNDLVANKMSSISVGTTPSTNDVYEIEISPDGKFMAVRHTGYSASTDHGVYWVNVATKAVTSCTVGLPGYFLGDEASFASLAIFPDNQTVAFEVPTTNQVSRKIYFWNSLKGRFGMDGFLASVPPVSKEPLNSAWPVLTPDGLSLLFNSTATNVVAGVDDGYPHVFLRELKTGKTTLVSQDENHQPIWEESPAQYAFNLANKQFALNKSTPDGDYGGPDLYLFDPTTQSFSLVSGVAPGRTRAGADGLSTFASTGISREGRFIAFSSPARDLVDSMEDIVSWDIFLADRVEHTVTRVSAPVPGAPEIRGGAADAQLSPDGRYVLYQSTRTNLVGASVPARGNLYMYDTGSKSTTLVSPANSADPGTATPNHATMSDDGHLVLYETDKQLILRDIPRGTSTAIATTGLPTRNSAQISADGSTVIFATGAGLYLQKGNGAPAMLPVLVGAKYAAPFIPTADGVRAGFTDSAKATFYLANLSTKTVSAFPIPGVSRIGAWAMNGDATKVVLEASTTLAPLSYQIYFLDSRAKSVSLISTNLLGLAGNGSSRAPSISADGKTIAFKSEASDLVDGDNNWTQDVFVQDASGNIELLSHNTAGNSGSDRSLRVTVSQDGSTAIFLSAAADLVEGYYNGFAQIFAASLTVGLADSDGDGLPDAWEQTHFGNLDQNATDDPDHDGATNRDELAAHTDPMDAQSVLRLALTTVEENNQLTWLGADGVRYQVQVSNNLGSGPWSDLGQPVTGTGTALSIPVILPAGNEVYYRLVIVP